MELINKINFPDYSGTRCLMMPYVQGDHLSVPKEYYPYSDIINNNFIKEGDIGYLTIDESPVKTGKPHRGARAKTDRALHTEAGKRPDKVYAWGNSGWGKSHRVELEDHVEILLANNLNDSCVVWDATHEDTSEDGDIGHLSEEYPYENGVFMKNGEVFKIGILTPHESLPVKKDTNRQFLRIVGSGVHGREEYFTKNPLLN